MDDSLVKVIVVIVTIVVVAIIVIPLAIMSSAQYYAQQAEEIVNAVVPGFDPWTSFGVFSGIVALSYLYYRRRAGQ